MPPTELAVLADARRKVLHEGRPLGEEELCAVLELSDEWLPDLLALAHEVRVRWCGDAVEVEGIVSVKHRRLSRGLSLLLSIGFVSDAGAGRVSGCRGAGPSCSRDSGDGCDRVLHRGRRTRP